MERQRRREAGRKESVILEMRGRRKRVEGGRGKGGTREKVMLTC